MIDTKTFEELKEYYDEVLNMDKSTYKSTNDEPTPIDCVSKMVSKIPDEFWSKKDLSILCLLYTSPSPRDRQKSRMPSSA